MSIRERYQSTSTRLQVALKQRHERWRDEETSEARVTAYVDILEDHLVNTISQFGGKCVVVGCLAWLSSKRVIKALARYTSGVLLVVNNENYDTWGQGNTAELFEQLPTLQSDHAMIFGDKDSTPLAETACPKGPVRTLVAGNGGLMHSKYLVFFNKDEDEDGRQRPVAVWTGSYNPTESARRNQENAVLIQSTRLADFYFRDFELSWMQSQPLQLTPRKPKPIQPKVGFKEKILAELARKRQDGARSPSLDSE